MSVKLFIKCKICNCEFLNNRTLGIHIKRTHHLETKEYYDKYLKQENDGICKYCNNKTRFWNLTRGYLDFCSNKCAQCSNITRQKIENTNLARYGTKSTIQNQNVLNRRNNNNLIKYGVKNPIELDFVKDKVKKSILEKYGVDNISKVDIIKQKKEETTLNNFGVKYYSQTDEYKNRYKQTCLEKYGVENISQINEVKEKKKQTTFLHYGVENPNDSYEIQSLKCRKYNYNNICFDSSWEIVYYIWLKDNNVNFEYHPKYAFEYLFNNKIYKYQPDFLVENYFVEIKGEHFFDKYGNFINPYNKQLNEQYKEKYKCMLDNNIIIIRNCDKYINYVDKKYGKNYIKQFKYN